MEEFAKYDSYEGGMLVSDNTYKIYIYEQAALMMKFEEAQNNKDVKAMVDIWGQIKDKLNDLAELEGMDNLWKD